MPSFDLGMSYAKMDPRANQGLASCGRDMPMPMVTLHIPLYRKKYKALVKEPRLQRSSVQPETFALQNTMQADMVSPLHRNKDAQLRYHYYMELLGQSRTNQNHLK